MNDFRALSSLRPSQCALREWMPHKLKLLTAFLLPQFNDDVESNNLASSGNNNNSPRFFGNLKNPINGHPINLYHQYAASLWNNQTSFHSNFRQAGELDNVLRRINCYSRANCGEYSPDKSFCPRSESSRKVHLKLYQELVSEVGRRI